MKRSCTIEGCSAPHYGRGLCKRHHQWRWRRGLIPSISMTVKEKIFEYSTPVPESGCWVWLRSVNNKGYGVISLGQQRRGYAHRESYRLFKGEIPEEMEVCHRCDVPCCVNPNHLFLGTHHENMLDSAKKGRRYLIPPRRGTSHHNAKFTPELLAMIRSDRRSARAIADELGCNKETVRRVRRGDTYAV